MTTQCVEVARSSDAQHAGEYFFETVGDREFVTIVCPKCLKPDRCVDHEVVQRSPLTITPSLLCAQRMPDGSGKECGWHGYVTNGVMDGA